MPEGMPHLTMLARSHVSPVFMTFIVLLFSLGVSGGSAVAADLGLLDPQPLAKGPSAWVVLDARPRSEWQAGHIPGARSFSWEEYTRTDEKGVRYKVWPPGQLAGALGAMGVDERTPLVIYGDADKSWGGEGWACWVFTWLGHKGPVRLLNGGIRAWRGQGLPLAAGAEKVTAKPLSYRVRLNPQVDIPTAELQARKGAFTVIDTRSTFEWLKGRIPGAVHIPWDDFYAGKERRPLAAEALKKLLRDNGVQFDRPVVYYCTGGIRSGYAWLIHQLAGLPAARNYEGGMEEWEKLAAK